MPFLTKDNLQESFESIRTSSSTGNAKFIRDGDKIFWKSFVPGVFHAGLIEESGLTPTDAGFFEAAIDNNQKILIVNGRSSSLPLPNSPTDREETIKLLTEITQGLDITVVSK